MKFRNYYLFAIIFYLVCVSISIVYNYLESNKEVLEYSNKRLFQSVQSVNVLLPKNFHHKNMLEEKINPITDMENIKKLTQQAEILGMKYIYTMIKKGDKIYFTSSSATQNQINTNIDLTKFGDYYEDVSPTVFEVFKTKKPAFDEYEDKWGQFHTLYFPIISEDGTLYVVGADIDVVRLDEQFKEVLLIALKDMSFYIFILLPFFLVYRANKQYIQKELEKNLEIRTSELKIKQKQLLQQSKMAAMGEMISNIAHQWRQPLMVVSTSATIVKLQDEMDILTRENLNIQMDDILRNTEYLSKTIDNFRNFFMPNREKELVNSLEIFDTVKTIFGNSMEVSNIEIIENIQNFDLLTYANELSQVIINIIKNSKDAIVKDGFIFVDCFVDDKIYIKIKDSGGGIPFEIIDKIYEPYFTTKDKSVGTGIGLNMSYHIVTEHLKGEIFVENLEYKYNDKKLYGVEFTITLPKSLIA